MIQMFKKYLLPANQGKMKMDVGKLHEFSLYFNDLEVGVLEYANDKWKFWYSEEFINTTGIKPLANFPTLDKKYVSEDLWPFFASRIPSLSRKRVKALVDAKGIKENDLLSLLKLFGTRTVANPYVLKAS